MNEHSCPYQWFEQAERRPAKLYVNNILPITFAKLDSAVQLGINVNNGYILVCRKWGSVHKWESII